MLRYVGDHAFGWALSYRLQKLPPSEIKPSRFILGIVELLVDMMKCYTSFTFVHFETCVLLNNLQFFINRIIVTILSVNTSVILY
jgi:hypothetical protein